MRLLLVIGLLAAMTGTAAASRTPREPAPPMRTPDVWSFALGPVGAMLESDYLHAAHDAFAGGPVTPCRLERSDRAGTIRLGYSCR